MMNDREFSNRKETLHGEFYENALKYPERIALIYENEKVSYKMLRLYALRAANYMWQRGVRRNDKIVVILPRGIGQVEKAKISCARKLFNEISTENVVYHDVDSYQNLLNIMNSIEK